MTNLYDCFFKRKKETSSQYCFLTHLNDINILISALTELLPISVEYSFIFPHTPFGGHKF